MSRFGLDSLDLYLIHWPVPSTDRYVDTWRALVRLQAEGRVRSIGVANFHAHHIERIIAETGVTPVVNQVELHPWLPQAELRAFDAARGIRTEAWSPLARGRILGDTGARPPRCGARPHAGADRAAMAPAARQHRHSQGVVAGPHPREPRRLRLRAATPTTSSAIAALETGERTGRDPDFD